MFQDIKARITEAEIKIGTYKKVGAIADELRRCVFIDEQCIPEAEVFDGLHESAVHVVAYKGNTPVATARVRRDGDVWHIGLVAVDKQHRRQHLGEKVVKTAINHIKNQGGGEVLLTSQQQVQGFYEKFGFEAIGKVETLESGFVLVPMKLNVPKEDDTHMVTGMCIGMALGCSMGLAIGGTMGMSVGIGVGMCLGLAVGASIKKKEKDE